MGDQATFSVRNVICEHSQQTPIGDDGGGWKKNKFPVFHVFGATDTGKKACLHVHGVLPYVVVRVGGSLTGGVREAIRGKLNRLIQREIDGGLTSREPGEFVYQLEPFRSRSLYGYCEDEEDFLRVYFSNPWYAQKLVAGLGKEVVGTPLFQAFESHVPFHLQFFMDYSVFGMDMIHMKSVKFRLSTTDSDRDDVYKNLTVKDIREKSELLSPLEKMTSCEIECDGFASDILNAELHKNNMYSSNPGLEYIWRDEISRRTQKGIPIEDLFNEEPSRPHEIFALERDMLRKTKAIARGLRQQSGRDITARLQHTNMSLGRAASAQDWDRELESSPSEFGSQGAEFDDDVAKDENDEEAEDEKDDEDVANEMTMCIPQESSADEDITLQESMDDEETFEDEHQHDDEEESEERNTSYDEMAAQEELDLSFQRVCDDGTNRRKAPADGHLHWVTTWSAFRQKWDVASELAEAAAEKKQVRRLRRSRSKSLAPTCVSSIMSTPSYRHSPTPGPTSQILSQRVDEMKEDESESEIVGLRVASLELFVETKGSMPDPTTDFIKCASLFIANDICRSSTPDFQFVISTFSSQIYCDSRTICAEDELELIREVAKVVVRYDVDILVGYDTERLSWGYLVRRAKFIGLGFDVSRFRRDFPVQEDEIEPKGRIMVSVWKVVRRELALRNYDRGTATANVLHRKLPLLDDATLTRYCQVPNNLNCQEMFSYLRKLARLNVSLLVEMNWFLQNAEMARVYGIQFKEVWTRGSQLRVESMLLRLARKMNFVAPSVSPLQRSMMGAPEQLQLILEPQSKVYFDPVIVLDFQSLYPSMVIAYNYCFSTTFGKNNCLKSLLDEKSNGSITLGALSYNVPRHDFVDAVAQKEVCASPLNSIFVKKSRRVGILPVMLREILAARLMVKNAMKKAKNKKLKRILDARQMALKLVANVSYGYTAANWSGRMPCAEVADAILGKGRETLERAIKLVTAGGYGPSRVIYGDTDSLFVLVPGATLAQAFAIGRKIAEDVTNANPDPVALKLEKVYMGCVLETKKRYAGWMHESEDDEGKLDAKGIETVRRDTAPIVAKVLEKCLELIFKRLWKAWATYLNKTLTNLARQPFTSFVFCKEFRGEYSEGAFVPQKKVAEMRLAACAAHLTLRGERVPYIIVDGPPGSTVYSCVCSIEEFVNKPQSKINVMYYIRSHILAALKRVTDLLPTQIILFPLRPQSCFTEDCTRIGQTPWCIECEKLEAPLSDAILQAAREERVRDGVHRLCAECRASTHRVSEEEIGDCRNWSCTVKQTWVAIRRSTTTSAVTAHPLSNWRYWCEQTTTSRNAAVVERCCRPSRSAAAGDRSTTTSWTSAAALGGSSTTTRNAAAPARSTTSTR